MRRALFAAWVCLALHACSIEDYVGEIEIAECLESCTANIETCSQFVLEWVHDCDEYDRECLIGALSALNTCWADWADCAASCTADLEGQLQ